MVELLYRGYKIIMIERNNDTNITYIMWQYTEKGKINGIGSSSKPAYFDMNYTYLKPTNNQIPSNKIDLSSSTINEISSKTYTGSAIKPSITVTSNNKSLKVNEDYTLTYSDNKDIGTAKILIKGIGNYTGEKNVTFKIIPKKISNLSLSTKTTNSLALSWFKFDNITGYKVYKYDSKSNAYKLLKTIANYSTTSYTDTKLSDATVYKYKIIGYKVVGNETYYGPYSDEFTESTKVNTATNLNLKTRNANSLTLSWNKVSKADGYRIYRLDTKTDTYKLVNTIYGNSIISYTDTNRASATNYYYKVKAFKSINGVKHYGNYSPRLKATTRPSQPNLSLRSTTSKSIKSSWTKISKGTTVYEVRMSTSKNGTFKTIGTTKNTSFTKNNLKKGKAYYFKIRAYKVVDGKKIYSLYSSVKSTKCK